MSPFFQMGEFGQPKDAGKRPENGLRVKKTQIEKYK
jgi:hypothetical protein